MQERAASKSCCSGGCGLDRREMLKTLGLGVAAAMTSVPAMAGPFQRSDFDKLVPADKKLSAEWLRSLTARGMPSQYRGPELTTIGMPVGGICSGQLYLSGDGRLWHWDIFNQHMRTGAEHYAKPLPAVAPLAQGFALAYKRGNQREVRPLDSRGFRDIRFTGQYPIGRVEYRDADVPVEVTLDAFSPFVPLDLEASSLPATVLEFKVRNNGPTATQVELCGWLQNAVSLYSGSAWSGVRRNQIERDQNLIGLYCRALTEPAKAGRAAELFANFEQADYGSWKAEGDALGRGPAQGAPNSGQRLKGFLGKGLVNTWVKSDAPHGKLVSPTFTISRPFITFLIGGGNHPRETCMNLVVGGKVVRTETGRNSDEMRWANWNVGDLVGKQAHLEIVDHHSGGWGHIDIDQIEFCDRPRGAAERGELEHDFGTMALVLLGREPADLGLAELSGDDWPRAAAEAGASDHAEKSLSDGLVGGLRRTLVLEPGEERRATFVIAWHFPNLTLEGVKTSRGRGYAARFGSASDVIRHVATRYDDLSSQTHLWVKTWYDSTLPYWLLDRAMLNTSILASSTCYQFNDGRFYGWEGVGCCPGTCTHVWHYAHAAARLFPQLERDLRERTDFGLAFQPDTGVIRFRGEGAGLAIDGQAGCILRTYREHQMSGDDAFLRRNWPKVKLALECLIREDRNDDGLLEGAQHNTLDTEWYGPVAWLSSLYLAALRAGEAMALELGDTAFATRARAIYDRGVKNLVEQLFDGDYFINRPDPKFPKAVNSGTGCHIDQVFGQSWAFQVGLGRVLPVEPTRKSLESLWRYNFTPDVGPYRAANKPGRWYAMPGEAGLLMCTFPRSDWDFQKAMGNSPGSVFAGYFNECMNGFEYQVAGHMIWEGMVEQGLAIARAVHDRYHPSHRNPWNEVECGDHYARSMASYGVFLAACGFEYHGPKGYLGFAPRLAGDRFRAPFTGAAGWGTFEQQVAGGKLTATVDLKWGTLALKTLALAGNAAGKVSVRLNGQAIDAKLVAEGQRVEVRLATEAKLQAGARLEVAID